jgi:inhibitor of KinA sporulation pathway (predicted exonuclease)
MPHLNLLSIDVGGRVKVHVSVMEFFIENIDCAEFGGKRVLEIGSRYVNGSVRPLIERFCKPREYIGIDIEPGRYVDIVLPAEEVVNFLVLRRSMWLYLRRL